jgi:hypothetical protein
MENAGVRGRHKILITHISKDTQAVVHVLKRFLISKEPRLHQLMDKVDLHTMNQSSPIFHWQEKRRQLIRKVVSECELGKCILIMNLKK